MATAWVRFSCVAMLAAAEGGWVRSTGVVGCPAAAAAATRVAVATAGAEGFEGGTLAVAGLHAVEPRMLVGVLTEPRSETRKSRAGRDSRTEDAVLTVADVNPGLEVARPDGALSRLATEAERCLLLLFLH